MAWGGFVPAFIFWDHFIAVGSHSFPLGGFCTFRGRFWFWSGLLNCFSELWKRFWGFLGLCFWIVFRALSTVVSIGMAFLHRRAPSVSAGPLATFVSVLYLNVRDGREHFAGRYFSPIFGKIDSRRKREIFILFEFPGDFCEFSGLFLF